MRKNTVISLTATLLAANISFAVPVFADDLQTYNLDTMVVTAQRESKRDVDTPASVTTVSQKQLVETGASNLFDALRLQSGVTTYSYGGSQSLGGMNAKILMRGANKGTVVMIDGVPANINETYYLDSIPVESIARVEIVKGAASTLYGSEASTGVINIITKKKMPNTLSLTKGEYGREKAALTLNANKLNFAVALEQSDPMKGYSSNYKQITGKFGDVIVGTTVSRDSYKNDITVAKNIKPGTKINEFRTNYAVFAQLSKDLGAGYTATVGARETVVEANKRYNAFTPQFALLKKLDNNSSLYANAAKSFKMPTFTQIYGGGGANFAANPLLEPEEGWTYEFGYKKTSNTSMFKAALYYMDLDTIEYEGKGTSSNPYVTRNMSFKNKGLEMTYEKDFGSKYSYSLGANFCNPMGKNKKGVWERKFAREQYNAGIKYHDAKFNAALTGMFTTDRASGWGDLLPVNFIAGYKFDKSSSVELGVENIFDRDDIVSNPGSATKYYCLPRMVHVTYTYTF